MSDTIKTTKLRGTELIVETSDGVEVYDSKFLVAALLIFVAQGSGSIEPEESAKMLDLIEQHFKMQGSESLELLTRAMSELAEKPDLGEHLFGEAVALGGVADVRWTGEDDGAHEQQKHHGTGPRVAIDGEA